MIRNAFVLALAATIGFACEADYTIWIPRSKSADPLYRFVKNGKAGYIDVTGTVVIPASLPAYGNYGSEFHDGLLEIAVSDGRYVDRAGKVVVDPGLFRGWDFSEGLAAAMKKARNSGALSTRLENSRLARDLKPPQTDMFIRSQTVLQ